MWNYANMHGYTDVEPFEITRVVSEKTLEVREMNAVRDESVKMEFIAGGFAGHCVNQYDQKWIITSDPTAPTIRIRLSKNGGWKDAHGRRFRVSAEPVKFYDYNF